MSQIGELPIPHAAADVPNAIELARIWAAGGKQHVSLATSLWSDPAVWGIVLADLARHIALAYEQTEQRNPEDVVMRIKEGFDAEWSAPTDVPSGKLLD